MAANPNPAPKRSRKIELVLRATDPTKCCVCGRALDDTTELSPREHFRHVRAQEKSGFKRGKEIVHYTEAQREARREAISAPINAALAAKWAAQSKDTPTPANTLETPLAAPRDASRDARWRKLEAAYVVKWPQTVWLFTLAIAHFAEGNTGAGLENLACFRVKVAEERERRRATADAAAWEDWLDASDARRWMA